MDKADRDMLIRIDQNVINLKATFEDHVVSDAERFEKTEADIKRLEAGSNKAKGALALGGGLGGLAAILIETIFKHS